MSSVNLLPSETFLIDIFPHGIDVSLHDEIIEQRLFKPRKDSASFSLATPIDWEARSRDSDRNWRMQLQGWTVFHPIISYFDTYHDKQMVLTFFFDLIQSWLEDYGQDPENIVTSRMPESYAWYDMSVGFRALVISFFKNRIDELNLVITPEQLIILDEVARKHISALSYKPAFSLNNNHGIFQAHGLMYLLNEFPQQTSEEKRSYALNLIENLIINQFDHNGVHMEHSPHYHFYVMFTFEAVLKTGFYKINPVVLERLNKARDICKWIVDPLRRPICIGDSVLQEQPSVEFPKITSSPILSNFDESGYQVIRSGWATPPNESSMVFLMGGYFSKTHKHRDCLSFDWFDQGARIICDGGKYGYKTNKYRRYCLSYAAHNSAEIEGFDILKMGPYGSIITPSQLLPNGVYKLGGKLDFAAIKQNRSIYFKPGKWLIVDDEFNFVRKRYVIQWFHLETDYELISNKGHTILAKGKNDRELFIDHLNVESESKIYYGDEEVMAGFISPKDYKISPALTMSFKLNCLSKKVRTVFALSAEARRDALLFATEYLKDSIELLVNNEVSGEKL